MQIASDAKNEEGGREVRSERGFKRDMKGTARDREVSVE